MRIISESEFDHALRAMFDANPCCSQARFVTGPGRSGAIAAVYASHILGIPFLPFGAKPLMGKNDHLLIIDTATESGATLRKAARKYHDRQPIIAVVYHEPPRVAFWYEATKPQRYRHERRTA